MITCDGRAFHLALVVDDDPCIVFEVYELAVLPPECLPLADDDGRHHLLPQLGFTLLDGAQDLERSGLPSVPSFSIPANILDSNLAFKYRIPKYKELKVQILWHNNVLTISPLHPAGSLLRRPRIPNTAITYRFLAPASQ